MIKCSLWSPRHRYKVLSTLYFLTKYAFLLGVHGEVKYTHWQIFCVPDLRTRQFALEGSSIPFALHTTYRVYPIKYVSGSVALLSHLWYVQNKRIKSMYFLAFLRINSLELGQSYASQISIRKSWKGAIEMNIANIDTFYLRLNTTKHDSTWTKVQFVECIYLPILPHFDGLMS